MLNKILTALFLIFLPAIASVATSQDVRPGKWWKDQAMVEKLQLNEAQITQLDRAYDERRDEMMKYRNSVKSESARLQKLFESEPLDENAIRKQRGKMEESKKELSSERFDFIINVRKIIGPEKFGRLKSTFSESRRNRHKHPDEGGGRRGP
jgi:Spy/CpxP family protein refolding chaperone